MNKSEMYHPILLEKKFFFSLESFINILSLIYLMINMDMVFFISNKTDDEYNWYYLIGSLIFFIFITSIHLLAKKNININFLIIIVLLTTFLLFSYIYNGLQYGKITPLIVFFGYLYLFCILPKYKLSICFDTTIILFYFIAAVLPLILFLFFDFQNMISSDGCFHGFSVHYNLYGYIAGIAILIMIIRNTKLKYIIIPFLSYGLILSQSRSSIIATMIASFYLIFNRVNNKLVKFLVLMIIPVILLLGNQIYSQIVTRATEGSDLYRFSINSEFINFIKVNIIWGNGGDKVIKVYNDVDKIYVDAPSHNVIIQTLADYGIIVLVIFIIFYIYIISKLNINGRALLLYIFFLGMFQPTLSIGISPLICTIYIIAIYYSHNYNSLAMPIK